MSNFNYLLVILSFSICLPGNSQQIFDELSPQVLLDAVKFNDLELRYFAVSTCKSGKLEVVSDQSTVNLYNFFTSRAKFKTDSNTIYDDHICSFLAETTDIIIRYP